MSNQKEIKKPKETKNIKDGKNRTKNREIMKKVLATLVPYRLFVVFSILSAAVTVILTLYLPILIGNAVDCIIGVNQVDMTQILSILGTMAVIIGCTALFQWILNICNNKIVYSVIRDVREQAFAKLQHVPVSYMDGHTYGDIVSRVIADVDQFADGLLMGFTQLFTGVLTIVGTLFFMFRLNWVIALVVVCITPISLFVARFIAKKTYSKFQAQSQSRGAQTAFIDEMIGNEKVVKAYSREEQTITHFDEINEKLRDHSLQAIFFSSITNPATRFVNSLVYVGVGFSGALSVISGGMSVGILTCLLNYANQYTKPFNEISGVVTELQNAFVCAGRIFQVIEAEPLSPDPVESKAAKEIKGAVSLENVAFSYVKERPLIENLNLEVSPGQRIAIVGPTGCGKTTLINLLMRFYDVNEGSIKIDGVDIRTMKRSELRSMFGMVLQDTWLRSGTIRENILTGKPDATDEEMIQAAKDAKAHSFIRRLPNGYDTVISEDGGDLSQGQKQLLCIARVMLCLPPMLILDEATSSIDTRTEIKIQQAFEKMMEGRTSFIVAHRLSTIQNADKILVMKDGHIIEMGNHEELLAQGGFYQHLYQSQFQQD